ncbi:hypothetical protein K461DRAFT_270679 [Myriangium duriaei CBS 260.36]|uniref:Uncharacterized protein n=1 Tax=Myriangium duriaei CBS 260.36 TaxID=1168546 RepID=A0A9P4MHM3_9PEZI|nr:hypothetical protein K461DRAFT_270679 [Myriangium duriaei CBS 260.36]
MTGSICFGLQVVAIISIEPLRLQSRPKKLGDTGIFIVHCKSSWYTSLVLCGFFSGAILALPACELSYVVTRLEVFAALLGQVHALGGIGFLISVSIANALNSVRGDFPGSQVWTDSFVAPLMPFTLYSGLGAGKNRKVARRGRSMQQQFTESTQTTKA